MRFVNRVLRVLLPSSGADTLLGTRSRGGDSYVGVPPSNKDISENASTVVLHHEEAQHDVSSYHPADIPGPGTKNCTHSRILYCPLPNIRNPSHEEEMSNVAHFKKGDPTSILYRNKILVLFKLLLCSSFLFATQNHFTIIVCAVPASVSEDPPDFSSLELLEASNPEDVLSKRIGDLRVDAAAMERSFGNDVDIVEWPVLNNVNRFIETLKDVIPFSYSSGDEDSSVDLYKSLGTMQAFENDIQKLALSLVRDSSSQNSIGENINRLHEISAIVLSLEHFLSNSPQQSLDLLPEEFHSQLPEILSKTAGALGDVRAIVGNIPGVKESPLESFSSAVQTRSIASSDEANASKNSKIKSKSRRNMVLSGDDDEDQDMKRGSKAEYEMRARGYHGFLAEDKKVNRMLHEPGGRAVNMLDSSFSFHGFKSYDFFPHENFQSYNHHSPNHSVFGGGQRRLNAEGQCDEPTYEELKAGRCTRLRDCAEKYTKYDLFMYYFGSDVDESSGEFVDADAVKYFDEIDIEKKFDRIKSSDITCDELLQEFHNFDESKGKWMGGSVTSICRGWGTTKSVSLQAIYNMVRTKYYITGEQMGEKFRHVVPKPSEFSAEDVAFTVNGEEGNELKEYFPIYLRPSLIGEFTTYRTSTGKLGQPIIVLDSAALPFTMDVSDFNVLEQSIWDVTLSLPCLNGGSNRVCLSSDESVEVDLLMGDFYLQSPPRSPNVFDDIFYQRVYTIYDFNAFKMVGEIYDEFKTCVDTIKEQLKGNVETKHYAGLGISLEIPITGSNTGCTNEHGKPIFTGDCSAENRFTRYSNPIQSFDQYFRQNPSLTGVDVEEFIPTIDKVSGILFGEETTTGQICTFAKALKDGAVDDLPGYCCLDSPDDTKLWGEQYTCNYEYGSEKGKSRPKSECKSVGPWWASFNEAACDAQSGTWCVNPKVCTDLKICIDELKLETSTDTKRLAFHKYLEDGPKIDDATDSSQCGNLREYFEFDRDYPDDNRICEYVENLQCRNDFTKLDESAAKGQDVAPENLVIRTKIRTLVNLPYNAEADEAFQAANDVISKALTALSTAMDIYEASVEDACFAFISAIAGTAAPCVVAFKIPKMITLIVYYALTVSEYIASTLYDDLITSTNDASVSDMHESNYDNIITSTQNGITIFKAVQQVKELLGDVGEDLDDFIEEDRESGRRLTENACNENSACNDATSTCNCEDKGYFCDCKPNYEFLKRQRSAGCDSFDSDGDGFIDICEDRSPPRLIVKDSYLFYCDKSMPEKLCYNDYTFKKYDDAEKFLLKQIQASDDCANRKQLSIEIEKIDNDSQCGETTYELTPKQNYPECDNWNKTPFTNPLVGGKKTVTVRVDNEDPVVICGFHNIHDQNPRIHIDGKTLFHYTGKLVAAEESPLEPSGLFYKVTDNCDDADINVDVVVKGNEFERDETVLLVPYEFTNVVQQVEFFYSPTSCAISRTKSPMCIHDIGIATRIRFYEISVTATEKNSAESKHTDTCRVIIVPECENDEQLCEDIDGISYFSREYLQSLADKSRVRYDLGNSQLVWGFDGLDQNFDELHNEYNSRFVESSSPSRSPSDEPSDQPSVQPSDQPSVQPSDQPSVQPSDQPSVQPSDQPSVQPSDQPSVQPSDQPSVQPSDQPSVQPSDQPSVQPSDQPSVQPSDQPSIQPSDRPSVQPSDQPSVQPSFSNKPSGAPTKYSRKSKKAANKTPKLGMRLGQ